MNNSSSQPLDHVTLCPFCGDPTIPIHFSPNGGELYVAEEFDECTEVFDGDINWYKCSNGHSFYAK